MTTRCCLCFLALSAFGIAAARPLIFPEPQKMQLRTEPFILDESVAVLVPANAGPHDLQLARLLVAELSDRYRLGIKVERAAALPSGRRFILMGSAANPLVAQYCRGRGIEVNNARPGHEGYVLESGPAAVVVAGSDDAGAFYGLQSLRQMIRREGRAVSVAGARIEDSPHMPFRAIRLYLPGHENIAFFKRFVRDFMALYKFNTVIMEMNGSMRLDRHPEVNAGWLDFAQNLMDTRRYYPRGPNGTSQNSAHHDTADGEILEKSEVAELVRYAAGHHIEVVPEIPSLTHSYYLLTRHRELAAIKGAEWPDTYCPTDPRTYELLFDVMDEYIEVMKPKMIHIGHDEMFFPLELCHCCAGKDMRELYAYDVNRVHDYLAKKGIQTGMYGDHLIESVRGAEKKPFKTPAGATYHMPGALTPDQVARLIPKDIVIFNWFWHDHRAAEGRGEPNDVKLSDWGFRQAHANFNPMIQNYGRRSVRKGVIGGAPSSWAATNEYTFAKDLLHDFLGTAGLMWSTHWTDEERLSKIVQSLVPEIRRSLSGRPLPSEAGGAVTPLDIAAHAATAGPDLTGLRRGRIDSAGRAFDVPAAGAVVVGVEGEGRTELPRRSPAIAVNADVNSILFLHAAAKAAANDMSYRYIHNFPDTADLLGWYEVVYEDGFVATAPVRFGVNILPLGWGARSDSIPKGSSPSLSYAYWADAMDCGSATLFAYEWVNPRAGKVVKEVRLRGTAGFRDTKGKLTPDNAIVLAAVSVVKATLAPGR
jgi:hypothetical protein